MELEPEAPALVQLSLFPEAFEVQVAARSALRDLDLRRARGLLERARRQNPRLTNLGLLDAALGLLEAVLKSDPPCPADLAEVLLAARDRFYAGRLTRASARFVDETIARYWRRQGSAGPFLDGDGRVHRAVLDLVLGDAATARRELDKSLRGEFRHRADLWGYLGDASLELDREEEAKACYVRALLLSAGDVDLMRIRWRALAELHEGLCRTREEGCARELLLVHAWLEGLVEIPADNAWVDGQLSRLRARAQAGPDSPPADRYRRFALLLYLDESERSRRVDLERRAEMAALDEDLFARTMHERRRRERAC